MRRLQPSDDRASTRTDPRALARAAAVPELRGALVDAQTRCVHYASALDVVAIRFACCGVYYPCYRCHAEYAGHPAKVWPASQFNTRAVLCGVCRHELTIAEYLASHACPHCGAAFNPNCRLHAHHYFEMPPAGATTDPQSSGQ